MQHLGTAIIVLFILLAFYFIYYRGTEHNISEPEYTLLSSGLNLPSRGGYYLGGLAVINAAENANRTDQITPVF